MVKLQIDLSDEEDKRLKVYCAKKKLTNKADGVKHLILSKLKP